MNRKVIVVIVEGKSDKLFITDRLEDVFDEYEVNFSVIGHDIFSNSTTSNLNKNILNGIKELISLIPALFLGVLLALIKNQFFLQYH